MLTKDTQFRVGDSITILIKNRPYVDFSVPPDLNDYRDCDYTSIKIYNPCGDVVIDDVLNKANHPGWYFYRLTTEDDDKIGLYRVEVSLYTVVSRGEPTESAPTTGSPITGESTETTGTTGIPEDAQLLRDVQVRTFRLVKRVLF